MAKLYEKLKSYSKENFCPMHMPGHKRKSGICSELDITEIEGFDNLASPCGIIKDMEDGWAKVYGADKAFLSVNGSTGAILAAIAAFCSFGDKIIMARNCHKSVYNAASLMGLETVYVYPDYDENGIAEEISPEEIKKAAEENPDAALIVITSPTYEGVISDIKAICEVAHSKNIPVFVDCAHGAHLGFMDLPTPVDLGADVSCMSLHKTLPSMTQTALLLCKGERADCDIIREKINMFQTSSPSYVLMASMGECLDFVSDKEQFTEYKNRLDAFYKKAEGLENLQIKTEGGFAFDKSKIVIITNKTDISGQKLMGLLREKYKIELEMAYDCYALAMTSVCDTDENFNRLFEALFEIDKGLKKKKPKKVSYPKPQKADCIGEETELISIKDALGRICADYVWAYPPGVPIIAPGELIDEAVLSYLVNLCDTKINGQKKGKADKILVIK